MPAAWISEYSAAATFLHGRRGCFCVERVRLSQKQPCKLDIIKTYKTLIAEKRAEYESKEETGFVLKEIL